MARDLKVRRGQPGSGDSALYLYCITRRPSPPMKKIRGIDAASPVEPLACGNLVCWTSRVPRVEFTEKLAKNMENLDWLTAASLRHQQVVADVARGRDALPARFGVVFLDEQSLCAHIAERRASLDADFHRVANCDEWGLKVFAALPNGEVSRSPASRKSKMSGKDYLRAKSQMVPRGSGRKPDPQIERFAITLENISKAMDEGGRIAAGQRGLLFQASCLIERPNRWKLDEILKRFSGEWAGTRRIECTGPWPPYSFVSRGGPL